MITRMQSTQPETVRNNISTLYAPLVRPSELQAQSSIECAALGQNADGGASKWLASILKKIGNILFYPCRTVRNAWISFWCTSLPVNTLTHHPQWIVDRYLREGGNEEAEGKLGTRVVAQLFSDPKTFTDYLVAYYRSRQQNPEKYRILNAHLGVLVTFAPEPIIAAFEGSIQSMNRDPNCDASFRDRFVVQLERFRREGVPLYQQIV